MTEQKRKFEEKADGNKAAIGEFDTIKSIKSGWKGQE